MGTDKKKKASATPTKKASATKVGKSGHVVAKTTKAAVKATKPAAKSAHKPAKAASAKPVKKAVQKTKPTAKSKATKPARPTTKTVKSAAKPVAKKAAPKKAATTKKVAPAAKPKHPAKAPAKQTKAAAKPIKAAKPVSKPVKAAPTKTHKVAAPVAHTAHNTGKAPKTTAKVATKTTAIMPARPLHGGSHRKAFVESSKKVTIRDPLSRIPEPKADALLFGRIKPYHPTKNEEYMSNGQKAHFRALLELWREELMEDASRTVTHLQDEVVNLPDPNDRATQEEEFALELRTRDRERKLLKKISKSLNKLSQDEYGYCEACGEEIGIRRLEARPTAELCIDCKELAEIKEKQLIG